MSGTNDAIRALRLLDLTDLSDDASEAGLERLCARALMPPGPVAAICIWPRFVAKARLLLGDGAVRIATVVNFPKGDTPIAPVLHETDTALADGADEIDLVMPWAAIVTGHPTSADAMISMVKQRCGERRLKVILETGEYRNLGQVETASRLAIASGADFIKTSTGKTAHSATPEAVRVMLGVIAQCERPVGLKPSGGIRTLADAQAYLALADEVMGPGWATPQTFRFGASGLHQALLDVIEGRGATETSGSY
jgi:deoxyribose-phosphate aldolase